MAKIAFITGATSGFGKAVAERFVREGWNVVLTGRRKDRLDALVAELGGPSRALALCFDIRDEAATRAALADLPRDFSEIDALINNAGLALGNGPAQSSDLEQWKTMIDTNITGLVVITRLMLDRLIGQFDPEEGRAVVQPTYRGKQGNPMLWAREFLPEMLEINGDIGARHLAAKHAERVVEVEMADDAVLRDFDTTDALKTVPEFAGRK